MRLGLNVGYAGAAIGDIMPLIEHADRVGIDPQYLATGVDSRERERLEGPATAVVEPDPAALPAARVA